MQHKSFENKCFGDHFFRSGVFLSFYLILNTRRLLSIIKRIAQTQLAELVTISPESNHRRSMQPLRKLKKYCCVIEPVSLHRMARCVLFIYIACIRTKPVTSIQSRFTKEIEKYTMSMRKATLARLQVNFYSPPVRSTPLFQ